jgi:hypothetical protein
MVLKPLFSALVSNPSAELKLTVSHVLPLPSDYRNNFLAFFCSPNSHGSNCIRDRVRKKELGFITHLTSALNSHFHMV